MIQILAFQANPRDRDHLRLNKEVREIQAVLLNQPFKGLIDYNLSVHPEMQTSDLQQFILDGSPQIVHFSGHGNRNGIIVEDANGDSDAIPNESLETIFQNLSGSIQCVVLNSCYSEQQAKIISQYVPCVVGMQTRVEDDSAINFSKSFYQALVYGLSIKKAFALAKGSVARTKKGKKQNMTQFVALKHRKDVDPSKIFLVKPPRLSAFLQLNSKDRPVKDSDGNYDIELHVTDVPKNATAIVVQYNHETVDEQFDESLNDGTGFSFEAQLGGNLQIKVNIWFMDLYNRSTPYSTYGSQYSFGFTEDLYSVLKRTHADPDVYSNKYITEAIEEIGMY